MLSESRIVELIVQGLRRLQSSGIAGADFEVNDDTVLIGMGSPVDSIAFVTLITDLEQSIEGELGREFFLVMKDIHDLNEGKAELRISDLAKSVGRIVTR
jgi:acyl carrier protein